MSVRINVSISEDQREFIKVLGLKPSKILQKRIDRLMLIKHEEFERKKNEMENEKDEWKKTHR